MPSIVRIEASNARDYPMFERNLLSHLRFAMVLSLLSSSILLNARFPSGSESGETPHSKASVPLASLQVVSAVSAIAVGLWQYYRGCKDIRDMRAFLVTSRPQLIAVGALTVVVFATCVMLIADKTL